MGVMGGATICLSTDDRVGLHGAGGAIRFLAMAVRCHEDGILAGMADVHRSAESILVRPAVELCGGDDFRWAVYHDSKGGRDVGAILIGDVGFDDGMTVGRGWCGTISGVNTDFIRGLRVCVAANGQRREDDRYDRKFHFALRDFVEFPQFSCRETFYRPRYICSN